MYGARFERFERPNRAVGALHGAIIKRTFEPAPRAGASTEARAKLPGRGGADGRTGGLLLLCVDDGDAGEVDDVFHLVAALEHVNGLVHPDEHRADGFGAAQSL
jgi:hypothetical protein